MQVQTASTQDGSLLRHIRANLDEADEALVAVAFVTEAGVHLLKKQLDRLGQRGRLLATTTFGSTTPGALAMAHGLKTRLRTLNPASGTFHSKAFLTRCDDGRASLVIGSSNLTGGLAANIEVGMVVRGRVTDDPIAEAWSWAESVWQHQKAADWLPPALPATSVRPAFDPGLLAQLRAEVDRDPRFVTLTEGRLNVVTEVADHGLYVVTEATKAKGTPAQLVPSWMFELAWQTLRARGELIQQQVLDELNIKRSAAVCAILARLPGVVTVPVPGRSMRLCWVG